ncbi:dioxygenase [Nisaea sp.]|uniref:dioxygenase family protein n=1 Tax=Nisaea sp. TaxID=2024842 RepID=UPI002B2761E6|nr:dioxygenase [Nisaea sp.]
MRNVDKKTITQAFMNYCAADTEPRLRLILERLVHHLHAFAKETELTHEEWRKGIELLTRTGDITDEHRNEFVLFSDLFGLSSLVDMIHSAGDATPSSVLGPFHVLGAPLLPVGGDLIQENEGDPLVVSGRVKNAKGQILAGAELEIWQTAANALYSSQDENQSEYNLRARQVVGEDGRYCFSTVRPVPYEVPTDGPGGELLRATGRHAWRPSHLHIIVKADGHRSLVTELFPDDDPYLDEDAVFGVREGIVMHYELHDSRDDLPDDLAIGETIATPYLMVDFDFVLADA